MKSLVLLYRENSGDELHIKYYSQIKDLKDAYIVGDKHYSFYEGISKRLVGVPSDYESNYFLHLSAPITLPHMGDCYWNGGRFLFVNKTKYDENPIYYQDMIMNYREE